MEFNPVTNTFDQVQMETFGKSGCRRIVPGQYLAVDPKGRAIMISAMEKQKLVYIMNRDAAARLTISSPLEAHKAHTLVFDSIGVDVGFENPVFACLEMDYEDADADPTGEEAREAQQNLTFYELDLGKSEEQEEEDPRRPPTHTHASSSFSSTSSSYYFYSSSGRLFELQVQKLFLNPLHFPLSAILLM